MRILTLIILLSSTCFFAQAQTNDVKNNQVVLAKDARSVLGEYKTIKGYVAQATIAKRSGICYLNFTEKYPKNDFTVVIFKRAQKKFDDLKKYANKNIKVTGKIKLYKGHPQIIVNNPKQIEIIKGK